MKQFLYLLAFLPFCCCAQSGTIGKAQKCYLQALQQLTNKNGDAAFLSEKAKASKTICLLKQNYTIDFPDTLNGHKLLYIDPVQTGMLYKAQKAGYPIFFISNLLYDGQNAHIYTMPVKIAVKDKHKEIIYSERLCTTYFIINFGGDFAYDRTECK
jgi:hypothetical protein